MELVVVLPPLILQQVMQLHIFLYIIIHSVLHSGIHHLLGHKLPCNLNLIPIIYEPKSYN